MQSDDLNTILTFCEPINETRFSDLGNYYEVLCKRHDIPSPPEVMICNYVDQSVFIPENNLIVLGGEFLDKITEEKRRATLAHELAHILRGDKGKSVRKFELKTDRLATAILGTKRPSISLIKQYINEDKLGEDELLEKRKSYDEAFGKDYIDNVIRELRKKRYRAHGTSEERMSNVKNCDLEAEKNTLKKLIEKRRSLLGSIDEEIGYSR